MATGYLHPIFKLQEFTTAGITAVGHQLFSYLAGTSTKEPTYSNHTLTTANDNPTVLDAGGRTAAIYLKPGLSYKFVLAPPTDTDPPTSPVWTQDNVLGGYRGGTYTPTSGGGPVNLITQSPALAATSQGLRKALFTLNDSDTDEEDTAVVSIDTTLTTDPSPTLITKTGLHVKHYTPPDNGGDASAGLFVSTGGGSALTAYQVHLLRPTGYTDYSATTAQGAFECGSTGGSFAILATAGPQFWGATTHASNCLWARLDNAAGKGIIVTPSQQGNAADVFDSRVAYAIGRHRIDQTDTDINFYILLDARAYFSNNVGIGVEPSSGTGNPLLHCRRASNDATVTVERTTTNASAGILSAQADSVVVGATSADGVKLISNNTERIRIHSDGNIGINGTDFQDGVKVMFIANATTNPTTNPTGGGILYATGGAGTWRGSGGTVTTFGPAEPHCQDCGRDFVMQWENERFGKLAVCFWCLTENQTRGVMERRWP